MAKKTATPKQAVIINAAIYTRVSTDDQADDGYGLDVQRARTKAQIEAKGWTFAAEYSDPGLSGTLDATGRPGLARLLEAAQTGKIGAIVVLALDRLARKTLLVLSIVEALDQAGVALVSCKESLDTSTPQGKFVLTMFAALAELERDTIVARTTDGRNERGKRDGERGGRVPDGYQRTAADGVIVIEERARIVRHIFDLKGNGLTLRDIAEKLNQEGYRTARGHVWHASSVRAVLLNEEAYRGGKRGASDVAWMPILTDSLPKKKRHSAKQMLAVESTTGIAIRRE